jgi:hypothetical protein
MPPRLRPFALCAAAALAILLLGAFSQTAVVPIQLDLASALGKVAYGALGLVGTGILWLAKQGLDTLNRLDQKVTRISHELFGPEGNNGMRSDVRDAKRTLHAHTRVLAILADREGIDFEEDTR